MRALKRCLGVDLGSSSVKIAELAIEDGVVKVLRAVSADTGCDHTTPPDERKAAIIRTAKELLKKNKFGTKNAVFGLPGLKVFIRRFPLPTSSAERLDRIVQFEARQQIPFPLEKTELQWQYFPIEGGTEVDVVLVAVRSDELRDYMAMVDKVGLAPISVGVSSFAMFNLHSLSRLTAEQFKRRNSSPKKASKPKFGKKGKAEAEASVEEPEAEEFYTEDVKAYINLGAGSYDITIARNGKTPRLLFVRTPPIGGNDMTRAIVDTLKVESFGDAERIKRSNARLMTFDFGTDGGDEINEDACIAIQDPVDRIISELRRSLDFFISQPDGMAVDAIDISGGASLLPGIETYIEEKLTIPAALAKSAPEGSALLWQESLGPMNPYVVALGLGLQGLGQSALTVDFLPRDRKIARDFPYRTVAVMAGVLLLTVGVASGVGDKMVDAYQRDTQNIRGRIQSREREVREFQQAQQLNTEESSRTRQLARAFGQRRYWVDFLSEIARRKPVDLLIDQISMGNDGAVLIRGVSESNASPATFVRDELKPAFPNATVAPELIELAPTRDARYEKQVFRFAIRLNPGTKINHLQVRPTPAPAPGAAQPGQPARPNQPQRPPTRPGGR